MTFVMLNGFYPLSERNPPPVPKGQYQDGWNTNQTFLHYVSSFGGTSCKTL